MNRAAPQQEFEQKTPLSMSTQMRPGGSLPTLLRMWRKRKRLSHGSTGSLTTSTCRSPPDMMGTSLAALTRLTCSNAGLMTPRDLYLAGVGGLVSPAIKDELHEPRKVYAKNPDGSFNYERRLEHPRWRRILVYFTSIKNNCCPTSVFIFPTTIAICVYH